jgi:hypothetical protein
MVFQENTTEAEPKGRTITRLARAPNRLPVCDSVGDRSEPRLAIPLRPSQTWAARALCFARLAHRCAGRSAP